VTMLDHALEYIARGWAVFPVHSIRDGHCSCRSHATCSRPGKHPRNRNGRTGATLDFATARRWWAAWPDANIGIATGKESGLIVVDIDDADALDEADLPETVESLTGGGGRHLLYAYPGDGFHYNTDTKIMGVGVDSRADGGYIVAPPSTHISGRSYQWEASGYPDGLELAQAPEWWLDLIRREPHASTAEAPAWTPDGELPENLRDMLAAIPADAYDVWRDVGLALNHADPVHGLAWWDWWSSTSPKYNPQAVRQQWRAMTRKGHHCANPLTINSILRIAESYGYTDPAVEHGGEVADVFLESYQRQVAEALRTAPTTTEVDQPVDLVPSRGLLSEIVDFILATSIRPQPELAVAAAVSYLGALAGRKYETTSQLRTNVYLVGVAESGAGKDHARKCIQKLAHASGTTGFLGGERIASGPGLISALQRNPSQLFLLDEFGMMLHAMTGAKADAHKRDLMATLMSLYSSASVVYRGTEYADQTKRERPEIVQPNVCLYGTTTPDQLYSALTSMQGLDGSLARMVIVHAACARPPRQRPEIGGPPAALVERLRALAAPQEPREGNLVGLGGATVDTCHPLQVPIDDDAYEAWEDLDDASYELAQDHQGRAIYARTAENAWKLALIYAVSVDSDRPRIDAEAFAWGREFALWTSNRLVKEVVQRVSDNEIEAAHKRVLATIRSAGPEGITRNELTRRSTFLRRKELDDVLAMLLQGAMVSEGKVKGAGRPTTVYRCEGS